MKHELSKVVIKTKAKIFHPPPNKKKEDEKKNKRKT
jgi:hypothetical protein